jgi:hypothetical protein
MIRKLALATAVAALATTASPAAADTTGLVGQWQLGEGAGTTAGDTSGLGDNGTLSGGVSWLVTPRATALEFDGATGLVAIPDAPQLEPSTVSVSAWIARRGSPGDFRYIVAKGASGCSAASYGLYSGPDGGLEFYVSQQRGTSYARSPDAGPALWDGNWHFVVGTYDGSTIRLFIDGTEVGSGTPYAGSLDYGLQSSNGLFIGAYPGCQRLNFLGAISGVQIWNRPLGADEISSLARPPALPVLPLPATVPLPGGPATVPSSGLPAVSQMGDTNGPPILNDLSLTRSNFTRLGIKTLTILYTDLHRARVMVTLMRLHTARCRKGGVTTTIRCGRYATIGGFTHLDHAGRNSVRLPGPLQKLSPGQYRLLVTSLRADGIAGRGLAVAFRVVR